MIVKPSDILALRDDGRQRLAGARAGGKHARKKRQFSIEFYTRSIVEAVDLNAKIGSVGREHRVGFNDPAAPDDKIGTDAKRFRARSGEAKEDRIEAAA
jgi:hypothetical protein